MDKLLEPVDYVRKGKIEELRTNSLEYLEKVIEFGERSNK